MDKNKSKKKSLKQQVAEFIVSNPSSKAEDVAVSIGINKPHASVILSDLRRREVVKSVGFGKFSISENYDKDSAFIDGRKKKGKKSSSKFNDLEFDEVLLILKEKYGKKEFLKKLKNTVKMLE